MGARPADRQRPCAPCRRPLFANRRAERRVRPYPRAALIDDVAQQPVGRPGQITAFTCLDNAKGDVRALSVARRVHDGAYTRMAGSPDSATPYADDRPEAPPLMPDAGLHPDLELNG